MSTAILLSSSPPKTFARSPTPAGSSSPSLPSPSAILSGQVMTAGKKRFKPACVTRDGFLDGFSNSRGLLKVRVGAENMPFGSQGRGKAPTTAVPSPQRCFTTKTTGKRDKPVSEGIANLSSPVQESSSRAAKAKMPSALVGASELAESVIHFREEDLRHKSRALSPLNMEKASSRRTDWTPTKPTTTTAEEGESPAIDLSRSFSGGLLGSFGYDGSVNGAAVSARQESSYAPMKRRRINLVETDPAIPAKYISSPEIGSKVAKKYLTTTKKTKTPKSKPLTITGLATSNYFSNEVANRSEPPLQQFLTTTQAQVFMCDNDEATLESKKPMKASKKRKAIKPASAKCSVLSPELAMKGMSNQDALFGSASQLARDESPSLTRDILEAIRESEFLHSSDPVPTQVTEPISIGSTTPRANRGTSRFVQARNLWSAAGRDEDNALLHVDTIDLCDTPKVRLAFAGKDVLLEPSAPRSSICRSVEKRSPFFRDGHLRGGLLHGYPCFDIDDIVTPVVDSRVVSLTAVQARSLHTRATLRSPRRRVSQSLPDTAPENFERSPVRDLAKAKATTGTKTKPIKPVFAGFSTGDLQKKLAAYHFKPVKKREKMIEVLDRCWEAKYGTGKDNDSIQDLVQVEDRSLTHGDFLSNVHGLVRRPMPKVEKPKGQSKKNQDEHGAAKEPKKRKKAEPNTVKRTSSAASTAATATRKRKSKVSALPAEIVLDIDDFGDSAIETTLATAETLGNDDDEPQASPARIRATTAKTATVEERAGLPTPPPTLLLVPTSSHGFGGLPAEPEGNVPSSSSEKDIQEQIGRAITSYKATAGHDHQKHPTWHEKILMYDPIILEELAAWLNTTGFGEIGEDREVNALEVRQWCESRGICCLWKGGWRGNAKGSGDNGHE